VIGRDRVMGGERAIGRRVMDGERAIGRRVMDGDQ
jgi:hypothetical protein